MASMDAITVQTVLGRHQPCAFTPTQNSLSTQTRMPQRMRELNPFTMSLKSQDTEKIVQSQTNSLLQTVLHKEFVALTIKHLPASNASCTVVSLT